MAFLFNAPDGTVVLSGNRFIDNHSPQGGVIATIKFYVWFDLAIFVSECDFLGNTVGKDLLNVVEFCAVSVISSQFIENSASTVIRLLSSSLLLSDSLFERNYGIDATTVSAEEASSVLINTTNSIENIGGPAIRMLGSNLSVLNSEITRSEGSSIRAVSSDLLVFKCYFMQNFGVTAVVLGAYSRMLVNLSKFL